MLNEAQGKYIDDLRSSDGTIPDSEIIQVLTQAGWPRIEIDEALVRYHRDIPKPHVVSEKTVPTPTHEPAVLTHSPLAQKPNPTIHTAITKPQAELAPVVPTPTPKQHRDTPSPAPNTENSLKSNHDSDKATPSTTPAHESEAKESAHRSEQQLGGEKRVFGTYQQESKSGFMRTIGIVCGVLVLVVLIGGGGFYGYMWYVAQNGSALTSTTILSHTIEKLSLIKTARYSVGIDFHTAPRDQNAQPLSFTTPLSPEEELQYKRDQDRLRDIETIQNALRVAHFGTVNKGAQAYSFEDNVYDSSASSTALMGGDDQMTVTSTPFLSAQVYPESLTGLVSKTIDPLGTPYVYMRSHDGLDYTIAVTFETKEAARTLKDYLQDDADTGEEANTKMVTIGPDDYVTAYMLDKRGGSNPSANLFGLFDLSDIEEVVPSVIMLRLKTSGLIDKSEQSQLDTQVTFDGEAKFGDAAFAIQGEGIKKGDTYYGIFRKLPTFWSSMSFFHNQWIRATVHDLNQGGYDDIYEISEAFALDEQSEPKTKRREQLMKILEIANREGLWSVDAGPSQIVDGARMLSKYTISLNRDAFIRVYKAAQDELAIYGKNSLVIFNDTVAELFEGPAGDMFFTYLKERFTFSVFFDMKGFPTRFEVKVHHIPGPEARALAGKQLELVFTVELSDINEPIVIETPTDSITVDEITALISGRSLESVLNDRQTKQIEQVREALERYQKQKGTYPASLDDLTREFEAENTLYYRLSDFKPETEKRPFLAYMPHDVFANAPYTYANTGSNYTLAYEIKLPPYSKLTHPVEYYIEYRPELIESSDTYNYTYDWDQKWLLVLRYKDGINVATAQYVSEAQNDIVDADADYLSDALERMIGTQVQMSDSDSDGYTDYEEVQSDTDPLGPGRIEAERLY